MTKDEALKLALEALEDAAYCVQKNYFPDKMGHDWDDTIASIKKALEQPEIVQVSPLEFVTRVTGKEEIIGRPVFWTQWPTPEIDPNQWAFDHGLEST
jgi:hypothetical protein